MFDTKKKIKICIGEDTFYRTESELMEIFRTLCPCDKKNALPLDIQVRVYIMRKNGKTLKTCAQAIKRSTERMRVIECVLDRRLYSFETNKLWRIRKPHLFVNT